ncbi:hypothetical protein G6F15_012815 [Rhizopus arrhizus]|nr:hypothetical protein G6F15_012815 [Rhizopus arrhizus]KAG1095227.1 hypothetical protein G6F40_012415 [Rhizopus arrhizus]KAG1120143.1 hypothetical protein G6F42_012815 [Rhizopus arrhizus]
MSGVQEDVQMGSPTASSEWPSGGGPSIRVNKNVFESLLQAVSQNRSTTVQRIRLREPDLYHGERSALAVNTWLSTVDSYYDLASLTEDEKFKYAITLLRGDALLWWNRVKQGTFAPNTWVSFRSSFIKEFCPKNTEQTARDKLAVLQQHFTVSQYISEFRTLQLQIQDMSSGDALDRFVRGLQPGLRVSVRSRFPDSLESAESMALAIESATNESCGVTSTKSTATHAQPHRVPSSGNRSQVQCFGCQGFGHYKSECPTWKKHSPSSQKGFRRQPNGNHRSLNTIFSTLSRGATVRSAPAVGDLVDLHSDTDHENLSQDRSFLSNVNNKDSDLPLYEFVLFSEFALRAMYDKQPTQFIPYYLGP